MSNLYSYTCTCTCRKEMRLRVSSPEVVIRPPHTSTLGTIWSHLRPSTTKVSYTLLVCTINVIRMFVCSLTRFQQ